MTAKTGRRKKRQPTLLPRLTAWMAEHGAELIEDDFARRWRLVTLAGYLTVSMHPGDGDSDRDVFARFDSTEGLAKLLSAGTYNQFSGKWNHHFPEEWSADECMTAWELAIRRLLPK